MQRGDVARRGAVKRNTSGGNSRHARAVLRGVAFCTLVVSSQYCARPANNSVLHYETAEYCKITATSLKARRKLRECPARCFFTRGALVLGTRHQTAFFNLYALLQTREVLHARTYIYSYIYIRVHIFFRKKASTYRWLTRVFRQFVK